MNNAQALGFEALGEAPASVVRSLEGATVEKLAAVYKRAECAGARAWMLQAIVFGVGQENARYRDGSCATLAKAFGCSPAIAFDLARIYRKIIHARLDAMGDRARFELAEREFYRVALKAADETHRPVLELLELAEERRRRDPKYSCARFKREMLSGVEPSAREPKMAVLLRQLAGARHADLEQLARGLDSDEWGPILEAAAGVLDTLRARVSRAAA